MEHVQSIINELKKHSEESLANMETLALKFKNAYEEYEKAQLFLRKVNNLPSEESITSLFYDFAYPAEKTEKIPYYLKPWC